MEKLNHKKFSSISPSEMNQIKGGRWRLVSAYAICNEDGTVTTTATFSNGEHTRESYD